MGLVARWATPRICNGTDAANNGRQMARTAQGSCHVLAGKKARADGLACSQPIDYKALLLVLVGARRELFVGAMSDLKGRLITICMLVGALAMIGLVLTGTLQMRVSRSPVAQIAIK
jgi:hypothetical protein